MERRCFLSAGKQTPFRRQWRRIFGALGNEIIRFGAAGGVFNFSIGSGWPANGDVAANGVVKQNGFLGHDGDLVAQFLDGNFPDVLAANPHRATLRIVKPGKQIRERGLARAGAADQRDQLPPALTVRLMPRNICFSP